MPVDLVTEVLRSYDQIRRTVTRDTQLTNLLNSSNTDDDFLSQWRVCRSCMCVGSLTNVIKISEPATKFVDTIYGALIRNVQANELKFMIQSKRTDDPSAESTSQVHIHPSSILSSLSNYSSPYLIFLSKTKIQRTFEFFFANCFQCACCSSVVRFVV